MTEPRTSGADLARVAFQAARAAAKQRPADPRAARKKRAAARRGDGRDPIGLGSAITGLMTDRGWEAPATGGDILGQWSTLCPELAATVQPVHYDAEHGRLDLRPASDGYATQLRLLGGQLAKRINDKLGSTAVRTIRVLAPGPITPPTAAAAESGPGITRPPAADAPVRTRDDAHPGFHRTRAAIHHGPPVGQKPRLERDWGSGEYAYLREPEGAFTDGQAALETAEASRGNDPDAVRQAAIRMARAEKTGRAAAVPTAFQRSA